MRIYRIANIKENYVQFEKLLKDNIYLWDQLPHDVKNDKKMWQMFLDNNPQFFQMAPIGQTEQNQKKFKEMWREILIRNPDFFDYCPFEDLNKDWGLKEEIKDFWVQDLLDRPYTWHRVPKYIMNNDFIWDLVLEKRPQFKHFKPEKVGNFTSKYESFVQD